MNKFKKFFNKYYFKIKFKISNWFDYKSPIYINLNFWKFIKEYWKVRKVFHKPILKKYKIQVDENVLGSDYFYIENECYNKWFYLNFHECYWKWKYDEIRYEGVPWICLIWKNKVKYILGLEAPLYRDDVRTDDFQCYHRDNLLYWEGILSYLYMYKRDIIKTYENNIWGRSFYFTDLNGEEQKLRVRETIITALKPKYADKILTYEYNKYIKKKEES